MTPTEHFTAFLFTTRVHGDANYPGTLSQGYRINRITLAVPEPESWATLLAGFAMVGAAHRRRRRPVSAA